ncbi:SUMO-activating enzyme subunit 2 [Geranomyces variabilis]|uniref:SUMO-activating enzyme subunit 2 n=1 Tax=Geranomyces variabilis TaxID=109894 RepID=A0AAD5XL93_9FUNG|nr:SUMO-activating enzyme subunit 2 [Geranomyces variabilis]
MDTINVSNLNRQFLFQAEHVKQSKAMVARDSVLRMQPSVVVEAYVANIITDPRFDFFWFNELDLFLNALDNCETPHRLPPAAAAGVGRQTVNIKVKQPSYSVGIVVFPTADKVTS